MDKTEILHELIDVVSGRQAHLSAGRADEMHESLTPGFTAVAPSAEQVAAAEAVFAARAAAEAKVAEAKAAAAPAPVEAAPVAAETS